MMVTYPIQSAMFRDFAGGPVVKTSSNWGGVDMIPGWGAGMLHALGPKKTKHETEAILEQIQ